MIGINVEYNFSVGDDENDRAINSLDVQMTYTLTSNSPVGGMVFKTILGELFNTKIAKRPYKTSINKEESL